MTPAPSCGNAFEGSEKSRNGIGRPGERIVPESRGQAPYLVPNGGQPTTEPPLMPGFLRFQGCHTSDDRPRITRLHDVFHLLFEPYAGVFRQTGTLCVEPAGDALLMVKETQQMFRLRHHPGHRGLIAGEAVDDHSPRQFPQTFALEEKPTAGPCRPAILLT